MASDIKINLDSKHLPQTAAAWQAWKIILALFACGFFTVAGGLLFFVAFSIVKNAFTLTEAEQRQKVFREQCLAEYALANNGLGQDKGWVLCRAQSKLAHPD